MRILIRTSKWAIWARRLASLAVPLLVIPVLLHRERLIESSTFHVMLALAFAVALLALVSALIALMRLWFTGDRGWDVALAAFVLSLACLAPFGWAAAMAWRYPQATDIATADRQLLPLVFDTATASMPPPVMLAPPSVEASFPNARTRTYPLNAEQAYDVVLGLVEQRGWEVLARNRPTGQQGQGRVNARVTTLLGWRNEVVLHVAGSGEGASIDMRSTSLDAVHDLGSNGRRLEEFLSALDTEVTSLIRDNPNITEPVIEPPSTGTPTDVPLPSPRP